MAPSGRKVAAEGRRKEPAGAEDAKSSRHEPMQMDVEPLRGTKKAGFLRLFPYNMYQENTAKPFMLDVGVHL